MQRVMIIGQPGSGKSTLACQLGVITKLPVIHIDLIHWQPGWVERDSAEKTRLCQEVHAQPQWIFEGGHSITYPERLSRAETVIWLDRGVALRIWRVIRRTLRAYGQTRPDLPENCPERLSYEFFHFIWRTRRTSREKMRALIASAPPDKAVHHLRSNRECASFLEDVAHRMKAGALGLPHR